VLPLITLTQIGVIVCIGVLIDTLLVRTVIVPAMAFLTKDRFWWPRTPAVSDADAAARHLDALAVAPAEAEKAEEPSLAEAR
jgi:RND superfamily putative drug exporter